MKNLFNNMDSSEVGRILEMHKNQGYSLSEQVKPVNTEAGKKALEKAAQALSNDKSLGIPGRNDNTTSSMQYKDMKIPETINIGSSLFKNGIADIDRNNTGYKDAIVKLKKIFFLNVLVPILIFITNFDSCIKINLITKAYL